MTEIRLQRVALRRSNVEQGVRAFAFPVPEGKSYMIAVIGNMLVGLGVLSLFTATLRLTKPGKKT